jgi:hypothetical protein
LPQKSSGGKDGLNGSAHLHTCHQVHAHGGNGRRHRRDGRAVRHGCWRGGDERMSGGGQPLLWRLALVPPRAGVGCLLVCVGVHMWGSGGGGQSGLIGTERLMLYTAALQV